MKLKLASILTLSFILSSCLTPAEKFIKKREKAKSRIKKILMLNPELATLKDSVSIQFDTFTLSKTIIDHDTIVTEKEVVDSSLYFKLDTMYKIQQGNIAALFKFNQDRKFEYKIIKQPEYIYHTDTIRYTDTLIKKEVVVERITEIDTKPSFWWSFWIYTRWWLGLILILIIAVTAYYFIKRISKND